MSNLKFFLPMQPPTVTHQQKSVRIVNGKPLLYEPQELKNARAKLRDALVPHAPVSPAAGPVRLVTKWLFPVSGKHKDGEYKTSKPDTDNLQKLLKDVMTDLHFWQDDAQVASEVIEKFWAERPGIFIYIEEVQP